MHMHVSKKLDAPYIFINNIHCIEKLSKWDQVK